MARELMLRAGELGLDPYGLSFHVGSQQTDPASYEAAIARVAMLFTDLREPASMCAWSISAAASRSATATRCRRSTSSRDAIMRAMTEHFGNDLPEILIEPGRFIVGDAGVVSAEVVLVSRKARDDPVRWVYLDIGRFGGLAETEGEAIKYRITTPHDGGADRPGDDRRADLRRRGHPLRDVQLPPAAGARLRRPGASCSRPAPM